MRKIIIVTGLAFLLASCKKEYVCECVDTDYYDGSKTKATYTFKETKANAKRNCDFIESIGNQKYNGELYWESTCELK